MVLITGGPRLSGATNFWRIYYGLPSLNAPLKGFRFRLISTGLMIGVVMIGSGILVTVSQTYF